MKKIAVLGSQGIPANYGGFESLVENIVGDNCSPDIQYTVFCSSIDMPEKLKTYKGSNLKYVPLKSHGFQSILYDIVSMTRCFRGYDTVLILGISGCVFLPVLKLFGKGKVVVNVDGLEHRREKWSYFTRKFLRLSEKVAVRYADVVIADNKGVQDYVSQAYGVKSELILYGGNHVIRDLAEGKENKILKDYGLEKNKYSVSVCRIEPENNCDITLEAFAKTGQNLVFVGNWNQSRYSRRLKKQYEGFPNIKLLESIYDMDILYVLRKNAYCYVHGHSAGGTNPSLVEAIFFNRPILAYDIVYNRETTMNKAYFFKNCDDLVGLLKANNFENNNLREIAESIYNWNHIAKQYEATY